MLMMTAPRNFCQMFLSLGNCKSRIVTVITEKGYLVPPTSYISGVFGIVRPSEAPQAKESRPSTVYHRSASVRPAFCSSTTSKMTREAPLKVRFTASLCPPARGSQIRAKAELQKGKGFREKSIFTSFRHSSSPRSFPRCQPLRLPLPSLLRHHHPRPATRSHTIPAPTPSLSFPSSPSDPLKPQQSWAQPADQEA